ncbi:MAG: aminoacyl-tRNA hydrolase [Bacteroidetes bacterium]|nr:aminoacyl-tRNA hydrolase [Bacteroidota bacterium]MBS1940785.1 aminoacyl-tRNA hydrolase [Bacteroidota bacterium]
MKFLIVGLGNPGLEYEGTRHNIGFQALDALAANFEARFNADRYADTAQFRHKGRTFILIKPQTFMNLSGKAVRYWLEQERLSPEQLLVVADDLALPFGKVRLRAAGGAGGHNGLTNIIELIGTEGFPRLRFGIGNDFAKGRQSEFVLGRWSGEEQKELPDRIEQVGKAVLQFGLLGISDAMNHFNKR